MLLNAYLQKPKARLPFPQQANRADALLFSFIISDIP